MIAPLLILFSAFTAFFTPASQGDAEKFVQIFQSGDAADIETYFNPSIQLSTPGKQGVYSRSQAKMILSDFFSNNEPKSANVSSKGQSENGAQYVVIRVKTEESLYRVSLFYRVSQNKIRIHELKIEK
jgi:hypothetical protein